MEIPLDPQVEVMVNKIKHYLITSAGKTLDEASDEELYTALISSFREEIMINWTATNHTFEKRKCRKTYYLSMEYMPGRLLANNATNILQLDLVKKVAVALHKDPMALFQIEAEIAIGNGGLGRLASCFLDSLATQKYPAMGYGMRYQYGIFEQELWCGVQVERPDCWLLFNNPWSFRKDTSAINVHFSGEIIYGKNRHDEEIHHLKNFDEVRALPYDLPIVGFGKENHFSVLSLRLWSTKESPRNFQLQKFNAGQLDGASENTALTDVLYPNDNNEMGKRVRLKQEFLLVSASIQDIIRQHLHVHDTMDNFADLVRIQTNDTHPALVIPELIRILMKQFDYSFEEALETTTIVCSYTNHTILREALEEWNITRLESLLPRQYKIIQKLDQKFRNQILQRYPNDFQRENRMAIIDHGQVKMAHLSIFGSHKINGVAKLHSQILQEELFRDFYEMFPHKFLNVTNGVTQRRWLLCANPRLSEFITQRIGTEWVTKFETIEKLRAFASDKTSQDEFIAIKKANKKRFIDSFNYNHSRQGCIEIGMQEVGFEYQKAIFDVQIKRIHEYKRQLMNALHILMIYLEVKESKIPRKIPRLWIFAGKAAPGYELAKNIIRFIYCLSRKIASDPDVNKMMRIVYVENYNVSKAELIIPAADLSEQISTAGMEASGTGNMKLAMNGALTIGTDDGANVEMRESVHNEWWPFLFGASAKENIEDRATGRYSPQALYEQNPQIMQVMQSLVNHSLVENDVEQEALESIYRSLMEGVYGRAPDYHFVLKDLIPYYQTQKKVEDLYLNPSKWAEYAIHNIAGMSQFSTDISIKNYADKIWNISPCEIDLGELSRIRKEFSELDKCRIFP